MEELLSTQTSTFCGPHWAYRVIDCFCCALLQQSRSQLLHRTLRSRLKPSSDVLREQRERRRVVNNKKLPSKTLQLQHYTRASAVGLRELAVDSSELCGLSSDAVQCDRKLTGSPSLSQPLNAAVNGCCASIDTEIPSSGCASSNFVQQDTLSSHQPVQLAYNVSADIGSSKVVEMKLNTADNFSRHSSLETQFPADSLEAHANINGECDTYDRYVMSVDVIPVLVYTAEKINN